MRQADFAAVGFHVGHELVQVFGRELVARHDHHGAAGGPANRLKIVHRVVRQAFVHGHIGGVADVDHQQGVAIGFGAGHFGRANRARGASGVVHHDLLAQVLLHGPGKQARDGVTRAACSIGHDHGDGAVGKVLRRNLKSAEGQQQGQAGANETNAHESLLFL